MKKLLLALCVLLASFNVWSQEPYSVVPKQYELIITVDYNEEKLTGSCQLTLTNESKHPVDDISFLLYRLMKVTGVTDNAGQPLTYTQRITEFDDFGELQINQINVHKTLQPGESTTLQLHYGGYLLGYAETGMRYIKDRISPDFTLIRFDTHAYPYPCTPNSGVLRLSAANKFDYSLTIHVPDSLVAMNGGKNVGYNAENGMATYRYKSKQPAWRIDIAIAAYNRINGAWADVAYLGNKEQAQRIADWGDHCMEMYRQWWGELHTYNGLTIIETEEGSGGQTDETTILLPSESFNKDDGFEYLYHELSHLWNVPVRELQGLSPRWDEGLATFCQVLAAEKLGNQQEGYAKERTHRYINRFSRIVSEKELLKNTPLIEYGNKDITGYAYTQAMIMFSVMYYWLGEETFNKLIGGFYQQYYESGASTGTFTDYCITHGNQKKLKVFFDDWVYTTNYIRHLKADATVDDIVKSYAMNN